MSLTINYNLHNSIEISSTDSDEEDNSQTADDYHPTPPPKDVSLYCGICGWRPSCLRWAGNIQLFLIAACFISFLQAAFSGYTSSQVTTLEKRFAIGSIMIGMINSFFEVGYITSVIYVSYVGSRGRVPTWISSGLFAISIGSFLWAVPNFFYGGSPQLSSNLLSEQLCLSKDENNCAGGYCTTTSSCKDSESSGYAFLFIFLLAQLLIGAGSSPILTLTPPFIDDHVKASKAPAMIAAQYAASAMGPVFGYALGALLLQYPADIFNPKAYNIGPDDSAWVGAWWVGFILLGFLVFIGAVILLMFPRNLNRGPCTQNGQVINALRMNECPVGDKCTINESSPMQPNNQTSKNNAADIAEMSSDYRDIWSQFSLPHQRQRRKYYSCNPHFRCHSSKIWTKFFTALGSFAHNKIYIIVCLCISWEMFMIIGFASFLPKYIEMEFHVTKSTTSAIAGGLIVPSGAIGILVGGLLLNKFRLHRLAAIRFVLSVNILILICITSFFFLGCKNPKIAGVTIPYPPGSQLMGAKNFLSSCNSHCSCDTNIWSTVCHQPTQITYISPCFAGCSDRTQLNTSKYEISFSDCSCIVYPKNIVPTLTTVSSGECENNCKTLIPFIAVLTFLLFLTGVIQNPLLMVTMRSVKHMERTFALGLQFVIIRIGANLPSPIVFGRVIDETCRHWRINCGRQGDCAFVDVEYLSLYITGLALIIKGSGLFLYLLLLYNLRRCKSGLSDKDILPCGPKQIVCDNPVDLVSSPSNPTPSGPEADRKGPKQTLSPR